MDVRKGLQFVTALTIVFLCVFTEHGSSQQTSTGCQGSGGAYAWLSCLIASANKDRCNPSGCARYAGTEYEKDLTCSFQKQTCGGCVPQYKLNGTEVSCKALEQTGYECPPGVRMEVCNLDACVATVCRPYLTAPCRNNFCGGCFAEYDVDGQWRRCPIEVSAIQPDSPVILGQTLEGFAEPIAASSFADSPSAARETIRTSVKQSKPILPSTCPNGELPWDCPADVCTNAYCSAYPQAKCRINNCGGCQPEFTTGIYVIQDCNSRECPKNTLEMVCKDDPCKYSTCKKYEDKNPVCRPSRCGGCRAMWYVNGQEVNCYEQYGVDVPCPNGESRQKCPKTTCRFKYCPVDRSITCVINNCGGCHREYHKRLDSGRTIVVDESRCQGWWNILTNRKKKPFSKKTPLPRPVSELSPNELDPMARRNKQRTVNAIEKFETGPKDNVQLDNQAKAFVEDTNAPMNIMEPKVVPQVQPPQIPQGLLEDQRPGIQQFMPKSNFPEVPVDPSDTHVLENPLINPPDTFVEYPQYIDATPRSTLFENPQNHGVMEKANKATSFPGKVEIIDNPLIIDQNPTNPSLIVDYPQDYPGIQQPVEVINNPLIDNMQPPSKINAVPFEQIASSVHTSPSGTVKDAKIHPNKEGALGFKVIENPLLTNPMEPNIAVKEFAPSVPANAINVQILDASHKRKIGSAKTVSIPNRNKDFQPVVLDRVNVESIDPTAPAPFINNNGNANVKSLKKQAKASNMNFWRTDMRLPADFFKFMLQGIGFHGIPLEGIQK
ncbi:uncharacterized protein [Magallana gigas]|uniref:uncharacterized protein n=1 Tax=Magallana gigas TaxID=29159 RepID=UPI003340B45B